MLQGKTCSSAPRTLVQDVTVCGITSCLSGVCLNICQCICQHAQGWRCTTQCRSLLKHPYLSPFELFEERLEEGHGLLELNGGLVARGRVLDFL